MIEVVQIADVDGTLITSTGPDANKLHKLAFAHAMKTTFDVDTNIGESHQRFSQLLITYNMSQRLRHLYSKLRETLLTADVIKHHGSTDPLILLAVLEHHGVPVSKVSSSTYCI